jgi:hypothetical protein
MITKMELAQQLRQHVAAQFYDESGVGIAGAKGEAAAAIYALTDPRRLRDPRYIGQTSDPTRRFLQHLTTARLWIPDEVPWWVKSPKLRPLYEWIRDLYRDEGRLPTMIVREWVSVDHARVAERAQICACLEKRFSLLNVEPRLTGNQLLLL